MNKMREAINRAALTPAVLSGDMAEQRFSFKDSFIGFAGHFPEYPILPAILQTLLAQILAEQLSGEPLQFLSLNRAKFSRELRPDEQIDVSLKCLEKEGRLHCATRLRVADETAASFTIVLGRGTA
jgi:3-hydroxyacyl-[acyl-carrier-protein] dehydratase